MTSDSRKIQKGCLFVCIKGAAFDGHTAAAEAIKNGAAAVVAERAVDVESAVMVTNTRRAYALICSNYFKNPSSKLKLIGVTGTNGKTTTTFFDQRHT